jgi:hypothetical protein
MRVSIAIHAPMGERFGPQAFESSIGSETKFLGHPAQLVAADVHDSGDVAVLTFDVYDQAEPIKIPLANISISPKGETRKERRL